MCHSRHTQLTISPDCKHILEGDLENSEPSTEDLSTCHPVVASISDPTGVRQDVQAVCNTRIQFEVRPVLVVYRIPWPWLSRPA
ncbi:unnamed protein product [Chondrus crispus]|uniref:Uncharacterized protein n=1 Tax=Chondrus crispus TaxID=2769 RepID=R7Q5R3_CHOCR|nr:unnamed protein product [Chondrus crispus]CDF32805.1 unnamed protein product [Chondrus crispus]|eukprot:XP_005712606.1 unnamed protein product [Chondrus crispus]